MVMRFCLKKSSEQTLQWRRCDLNHFLDSCKTDAYILKYSSAVVFHVGRPGFLSFMNLGVDPAVWLAQLVAVTFLRCCCSAVPRSSGKTI